MKKNDLIEVDIEEINNYGLGIAHCGDSIIEVPKTDVGERILVRLERFLENGKIWIAKKEKTLLKSSNRYFSSCEQTEQCMGCQFDFLKYPSQIEFKKKQIAQFFQDFQNIEIIESPFQFHYRNNAKFILSKENEQYRVGNIQNKKFIAIKNCFTCPSLFASFNETIVRLAEEYKISLYNPVTDKGFLKHYILRYSFAEKTAMLVFVTKSGEWKNKEIISKINTMHPEIVSIYQKEEDNSGKNIVKLLGESFLIESFLDHSIKIKITPETLLPVNSGIVNKVIEKIKSLIDPESHKKIALDLYSGNGLFSLVLSQHFKLVYGIEKDFHSVKQALFNANLNKIENVIFLQKMVENVIHMQDLLSEKPAYLFIHPPFSKNLEDFFFQLITQNSFEKIFVLSSYPEKIKEDRERFEKAGYRLAHLWGFDFLPQTYHIEILAVFESEHKETTKKKIRIVRG